MSDKKHIDRLFQEQLKNLDKAPDPKVWSAIEAQLKEDKKRKRIIPIWWYGTGAAALLLLFLALNFFNSSSTNPALPFSPNSKTVNTPKSTITPPETESTAVSITDIDTRSDTVKTQKKTDKHSGLVNNTEPHYNTTKKSESQNINSKIATSKPDKSAIKTYNTKQNHNTLEHIDSNKNQNPAIVENTKEDSTVDSQNTKQSSNPLLDKTNTLDSLSIEEAIANTKTTPKTNETSKKWDIKPNVAPVYYNSLGSGSHLDAQLVNNSTSGQINASYGVGVGYAVNDKLKIRSGVNNLNLSFNINDVATYQNASTISTNSVQGLENLSTSSGAENISFYSNSSLYTQDASVFNTSNSSSEINQNISYFEVPLELEYHVINKRLGVSLIGGFSTFILEDNRVYSEGNSNRIYIGEATNINTFSFSTNFGIGLDYNLTKRLNFNLEPTFKYQLNAFSNTSGSFKPYIIGIYTGFNYQF